MVLRKRFCMVLSFAFLVCFFISFCSALGVSPAKKEFEFYPNVELIVPYKVFGVSSNQELELYVSGDLKDFVKLSKYDMIGPGEFALKINFPEKISKPGEHRIFVGVKEKIDDELVDGVGTSVIIQSVIIVNVPYPGRYLDVFLSSGNVNFGEDVLFELRIENKGKENVTIVPRIEVMTSDEDYLETVYFRERLIESQSKVDLKKVLNASSYNPGKYRAVGIVDYGEIASSEVDFRIGELSIDLVNYSREVVISEVSSFDIEMESGWNDVIDSAYAEVSVFNNSGELVFFKTSPESLSPWERKKVTGYFDSSKLKEGYYDVNLTFFYYGEDIGESSSEIVSVNFVEKENLILVVLLILIVILIVMAVVFFIRRTCYGKKK